MISHRVLAIIFTIISSAISEHNDGKHFFLNKINKSNFKKYLFCTKNNALMLYKQIL